MKGQRGSDTYKGTLIILCSGWTCESNRIRHGKVYDSRLSYIIMHSSATTVLSDHYNALDEQQKPERSLECGQEI